jgi:hypothetical protein
MSEYSERLKHPKWQEKRLRILERDEFTCQGCDATDKTLHVHHGYYRRGLNPWEYENETLYTFCEDCHEREQALLDRIQQRLGYLGLNLGIVLGVLDALASEHPRDEFVFESPTGFGLGPRLIDGVEVFAEATKHPRSGSRRAARSSLSQAGEAGSGGAMGRVRATVVRYAQSDYSRGPPRARPSMP